MVEHYGGQGFLVGGVVQWSTLVVNGKRLFELDADGDGRTNGEELLDPTGSWTSGSGGSGGGSAHPGDPRDVRMPYALDRPVLISQLYAGGGLSNATFRHDYVELFNRSTAPVSLAGWSIQYAPPSGSGTFGSSSSTITELPAVTLQPGQYYLIQQASAGVIGNLPAADHIDSTPIDFPTAGGRVALVSTTAPVNCNSFPAICSAAQLASFLDQLNYGSAFFAEDDSAPAASATSAFTRRLGGCADIDSSGSTFDARVVPDFSLLAPTPRTTATPFAPCSAAAPPIAAAAPALGWVPLAGLGLLLTALGLLGARKREFTSS